MRFNAENDTRSSNTTRDRAPTCVASAKAENCQANNAAKLASKKRSCGQSGARGLIKWKRAQVSVGLRRQVHD